MQKNEEDKSKDITTFSESASSPEKDETPVEAGSAGGAPVGGADAEEEQHTGGITTTTTSSASNSNSN